MQRHALRLLIIGILALAALVGVIVLLALGQASAPEFAAVAGALAVLLPAVLDASVVERRRRTPGIKAIDDDRA
jgi:hypothetical protein